MKTITSFVLAIFFAFGLFAQDFQIPSSKGFSENKQIVNIEPPFPGSHVLSNHEHSSHSPLDRVDSSYQWRGDMDTNEWQLSGRTYYTSDAVGNITNEEIWNWDGIQWNTFSREAYTYDITGKLTNELSQIWNGTNWQNDKQTIYTFDSNEDLIHRVNQVWDGSEWINFFQYTYTYDSTHNILSFHTQLWLGSDWAPGTMHVYTYDENYKEILHLVQNWNGGWVNNIQLVSTYDGEGNLAINTRQQWVNDHWENVQRNLYAYDANLNRTLIQIQIHLDSVWLDNSRFIYTYDAFNNIINLTSHQFANDVWNLADQFVLTYDANQNRVSEIYQLWENGWLNQDSIHNYYTSATSIMGLIPFELISINPNPADNMIQLNMDIIEEGELILEIYSMAGVKVLASTVNSYDLIGINISNLANGMYNVVVGNGYKMYRGKFIKL